MHHDAANPDRVGRLRHPARPVTEQRTAEAAALIGLSTARRANIATGSGSGILRRNRPGTLAKVTAPDARA